MAETALQGVGDVSANVIVLVEMLAEANLIDKEEFMDKVSSLKAKVQAEAQVQREAMAKKAEEAFKK